MNKTLKVKNSWVNKKLEAPDQHYLSLFNGESDESKAFFARHASSAFAPKNKVHGEQVIELVKATWKFADWKKQKNDALKGKKLGTKKVKTGKKISVNGKMVDEFKEVDVFQWTDVIDFEEFTCLLSDSAIVSPPPLEGEESDPKKAEMEMFKKYDANNDGFLTYAEYMNFQREFIARNGFAITYYNATNVCNMLCTPVEEGGWGMWPAELRSNPAAQFEKFNDPSFELTFEDFKNIFCEHLSFYHNGKLHKGWFGWKFDATTNWIYTKYDDLTPEEQAADEWQKTPNYPTNMKFNDLLFYINTMEDQFLHWPADVPACKVTAADA